MEIAFAKEYWKELFYGKPKGKPKFGDVAIKAYKRALGDIRAMSLEAVRRDASLDFKWREDLGCYTFRTNRKYRVHCQISIRDGGERVLEILTVEDYTNHYGD
jgi:hypothetical protein